MFLNRQLTTCSNATLLPQTYLTDDRGTTLLACTLEFALLDSSQKAQSGNEHLLNRSGMGSSGT